MMDISTLLLGQSERITSWFTTMWMISAGVLAGLLVVLLFLLKVWVFSRIGGLNRIGNSRAGLWTAGLLTGGLLAVLAGWGVTLIRGFERVQRSITERVDGVYGDGYLTWIFPAAACLLIGFGFWAMVSTRRSAEVLAGAREGFLKWMNWICVGMGLFALVGYGLFVVNGFGLIKFVNDPNALLASLARLPASGIKTVEVKDLAPSKAESTGEKVAVDFPGEEVRWIEFSFNQQMEVVAGENPETATARQMFRVPSTSAVEPARFSRGEAIPDGPVDQLHVANRGRNTANGFIRYLLMPVYPEVVVIPISAGCTIMLYLLYLSAIALFPKVSAISLSTFKTEVNQPLFFLVLLAGLGFITVSIFLPYNTFGEDIKMYKDGGLTLIRVLAIFVAIWASSKSVAEEIEGRTALTVLSKPVGRRQFVVGKISGITLVIALLFVLLGLWFVFWTAYKPLYDSVESSRNAAEWSECFTESTGVIPALFLAFLEASLFVVISVMISTRLGILPNLVICFSIYVLGHITPLLVMSSTVVNNFEPVVFFGKLVAIVFPVLDNFNVEAAIMTNSVVPISYMLLSLLYTLLYGSIGVLLSFVLFEDRDLA